MRMLIDVQPEDAEWLRKLAIKEHRTPREQASYLLHKLKEAAGLDPSEASTEHAAGLA